MNITAQDASSRQLNNVFIGLALCWSLVIGSIFAWDYHQTYTETFDVARSSARDNFNNDLLHLRWANLHEGIYVPVSPETAPNPEFSALPERDIRTPSGKKLTWIHPVGVARQLHELEGKYSGTKGHIVSLECLSAESAPDEWEKRALQAFAQGKKEVSSVDQIGRSDFFRLMRPLTTDSKCVTCHEKLGYKVGDIWGGLSVSIPWAPYRETLQSHLLVDLTGFGVLWIAGILGIGIGRRRIQRQLSENRKAELALRESEQRYRILFSHAMEGIVVLDSEKNVVSVNDSFARMHGYSVDEMLSMNLRDLDTPETLAELPGRVARILAGESIGYEEEHFHKDGHIVPLDVASSAIDIGGKLLLLSFHRDITERKRSEALTHTQLRLLELGQTGSAEELVRAALDAAEKITNSQIGFVHFVDADQEHMSLQIWSTNTLKSMCASEGNEMHHPISSAGAWADCFHVRSPVIHNDYASITQKKGLPEGHVRVMRELVVPIIREGKVTEIIGVGNKPTDYDQNDVEAVQLIASMVQDLMLRRRAEETLRISEERYRTVANFTSSWEYWLLPDGSLPYVSPSCEKISGYPASEFQQDPALLERIVHPDDRARVATHLQAVKTPDSDHAHHELEFRILTRLGEERWIGHVCQRVFSENGKYMGRRATNRDITARKKAEQEIERAHLELRALSNAVNQALEDERRRTARELHDELGQSLTALKMDLESLSAELPTDQPKLMQRIRTMHTLLSSTVASTRRIAANLRPLMLDDLGLAAALDWLINNFSDHSGIATKLILDDGVGQLSEQATSALYRITQESLTNVAKYAQATEVEVSLACDGDWIQLMVRDNGCGIAAADQEKPGRFGLIGIRERVKLLSGEVTIKGEPGRGSELRVRIPRAAAEIRDVPT